MNIDQHGLIEPAYKARRSVAHKARRNKRRSVLEKLEKIDKVTETHNMYFRSSKPAIVDTATSVKPDPAPNKLFKDQRKGIAAAVNELKKLGGSEYKGGDIDRIAKLRANIADMVS